MGLLEKAGKKKDDSAPKKAAKKAKPAKAVKAQKAAKAPKPVKERKRVNLVSAKSVSLVKCRMNSNLLDVHQRVLDDWLISSSHMVRFLVY